MNDKPIDWPNYFEDTKNYPPAPLLIKALEYVRIKNKALDIGGGGTLKDTKFLLSQGFETTILDKEKVVETAARKIKSAKLKFFITDFVDFDFPQNEYDIAAAIYSLPFVQRNEFPEVFNRIKRSIVKGGIFCGQFFGDRDGWNLNKTLTFLTKEKARSLLEGMDIIVFEEKEFDGKTADRAPKHWHVFDIIARKE